MSWLLNLYETYENHFEKVGQVEKKHNNQEYTLLPISHTTQNAHIEVLVTEDGQFHSARVLEKEEFSTLIPCTEESASRAGSKVAPYPLHDKISYVAGDFVEFGGQVKKEVPFDVYIENLEDWTTSEFAHPHILSIFQYLKQKRLIKDLLNNRVLFVDEKNCLISKWDPKYEDLYGKKPAVFSAVTGEQESAFVRFSVHSSTDIIPKTWNNPEIYASFISYYNGKLSNQDLCFVTGKFLPSTTKHTNKIRHAADKAKLISANDSSGFTYRGLFHDSNEVASISYDVSQKAHNALKWLISKQATILDQRVFLVWGNTRTEVPKLTDDTYDIYSLLTEPVQLSETIMSTNESLANELSKALAGYKHDFSFSTDKVNILVLDSATTGRMAVLYYRNMDANLYFERISHWHSTCRWLHYYRKNNENKRIPFEGAPSSKDIAFAAYGPRAADKVVKGLMERILPCIIDNSRIPPDIVRSAIHRASNPVSMEHWEWEKVLSITCALINKKEGYKVTLDLENHNRDYLFGRLLAVADVLERRALGADESRATNAIRYMHAFSMHPERTWKIIQDCLQPYQARLGTKSSYLSSLIDEIATHIHFDDFDNKPLSGKYLLGFYSQRHALYQKREKTAE